MMTKSLYQLLILVCSEAFVSDNITLVLELSKKWYIAVLGKETLQNKNKFLFVVRLRKTANACAWVEFFFFFG